MDRRNLARSGMSLQEIADAEGVSTVAIRNWFYRRDTTYWLHKPANFYTDRQGYERWRHKYQRDNYYYHVHRLLAVAEYGVDAVKGKDVHHRNGVKWDNRPDNIELLDPGKHSIVDETINNVPDPEERTRAPGGYFVSEES